MRTSRLTRQVLAVCGTGALLLTAAACGSNGDDGNDGNGNASGQAQQYGDPPNGPQGRTGGAMPGANGKVAAVDGSTAQVQSQMTGQLAVTWTASTTFTKQVAAKLADIQAGDCVMVEPTDTGSDSSGSTSTTPPTAVTAATVRITEKTDGSCAPAMRAGGPQDGGGPQVQQNGEGPGAAPDGAAPGDGPQQFRGFGAFGEVKAVTGNGFTVTTTLPAGQGSESTTTEVTVTVTGDTTYTTTAKGTAADVKVGVCVRADGSTDSTGAVTATSIAVTPAVDGQCGGMVFRRDTPGGDSGSVQES